jgi:hypothetical protein
MRVRESVAQWDLIPLIKQLSRFSAPVTVLQASEWNHLVSGLNLNVTLKFAADKKG